LTTDFFPLLSQFKSRGEQRDSRGTKPAEKSFLALPPVVATFMLSMTSALVVLMLGGGGDLSFQLDLAEKAEPAQARRMMNQVLKLLERQPGKDALRERFARLLTQKATTPDEILEVLGPRTAKSVQRQVLFRRYLEQWVFEAPIGLCVVFEAPRGQEPRVKQVFALP
jgi:hypothetical protein